jgi:hypothetical protein
MTLEELENALPNGLHDAEVQRISVDYGQRSLVLELVVWFGSMDDPPERREAYKTGRLEFSGLAFLIMEPPDAKYPYRVESSITVDSVDPGRGLGPELLASLPKGVFCHSFFVFQWNAFMHVAAKHAEMTWLNDGAISYRTPKELKANS